MPIGFQVLEFVSVKDRTGFDCFEIKRTVQVSARFQFLGHAVLESKILVETANGKLSGPVILLRQGVLLRLTPRAVTAHVSLGYLGPDQDNDRRVVHPHDQRHERSGGSIA